MKNEINSKLLNYAKAGNLEEVQYLVENGANVNAINEDGETALWWALENEHLEIVEYLLEHGADTSKITIVEWASAGWLEKVRECIENGADINSTNGIGDTALVYASSHGHLEIVEYLVENGAEINTTDKNGETALWWALENEHLEIVEYLLEHGADTSKITIVEWASAGWLEKVRECIENGADINIQDDYGETALIWASSHGHLEIVEYLVENGANVNAINEDGETALWWADEGVVEYLKSKGAIE